MMMKMFWISVVLLFCFRWIDGRHFLGGSMTWKPRYISKKSPNRVHIDLIQRYVWRRHGQEYCNGWMIHAQFHIGNHKRVKCLSKDCPMDYYPSVRAPCIAYSELHDWSASEKSSPIIIQKNKSFEIAFDGIDWSDELNKDDYAAVSISTFISTVLRSDGTLNTPPSTVMPFVQYVPLHSIQSWKIPVFDANGDRVRCRWANSLILNECGDVCGAPSNVQLNVNECILTYNATEKKPAVIALKIEDFESNSSNTSLSGISFQFIIRVNPSSSQCTEPPRHLDQSKNGLILQTPVCQTINEQVQFFTNCADVNITNVDTSKPSDMIVSNLERNSINHSLYTINMTWAPTYDDIGTHLVCVRPIDSLGQYGYPTCTEYSVIDNDTNENVNNSLDDYISESMAPIGPVNSSQSHWAFHYGRSMHWSNRSDAFIRFYAKSTHKEVYGINVRTNLTALNHSGTSFTFLTRINWTEGEEYYIHLDRGILTDTAKCARLSPAVQDPSFWTFEISSRNRSINGSSFFVAPLCEVGSECDVFKKYCSRRNPCQNNGICQNSNTLPSRYSCQCLSEFNGSHCEIDNRPCQPNPCWNSGSCNSISADKAFTCSCQPPWEGHLCETKINYCHGVTCQNGGVCQSLSSNWTCKCLGDSYYGRYCEFTATKIIIYKVVSKSFAYVAIIAMVVAAIFVIVMDILKYCFDIDPVHNEREKLRREKLSQRRQFVVRRYDYANRADETHVSAASFAVVVETIA